MSTEILNRTPLVDISSKKKISEKKELPPSKVNIDVLKKKVFDEKKRERFQNRVLIGMFCISIAIMGYIIV